MNKKKLEFNVKNNDYFGTLATVIDLQVQKLRPEAEGMSIFEFLKVLEETNKVLDDKSKELMYLQDHYRIVKKH